ncbi:type II CAAX endopeptidase family protein [Ruegeria sp.]|uniref:CPBP family intramembrane glutamic endopeptidase n=1 Tax=Ruegeria sp. TaxID=1879320 RepID=UPI00230D7BC5|nr:type II CAAX endopeptidase family protein [Ruegeria sp.]MDA7963521.1 CPBP family intramembrane metalloprotease [Ruegeria sp.]
MPVSRPYAPHEYLVAEARPYPEIWRLLTGLIVVTAVVVAMNAVLFIVVASLGPPQWVAEFLIGATPVSLLVVLSSFAFTTLGVALAARHLQHRTLRSIIGERSATFRQFWRVLGALTLLGAVLLALPPYGMGAALQPNLAWSSWLPLLPLSLTAVLIQTSAEEILFRGYFQQSLAARFRSPLIWMGVPSVLFALGHYAPALAGDNAVLVTLWACIFGLLTADLTARSGTLGPAIALHFFNNASALLVISVPDSLSGLALYHLPYTMSDTGIVRQWLYVDFALMIIGWLTVRLALRR